MARKVKPEPFADIQKSMFDTKQMDKLYRKLDEYQRVYYESIMDKPVVFCNAPAGVGKTTIAIMVGLILLNEGKISKLVYLRTVNERTNRQGWLPGSLEEKSAILFHPFYDAMIECGIQLEYVDKLIEEGILVTTTDVTMRGRNIKNSLLILDESQNLSLDDLQLLLTRVSDNSKSVVIGHSKQIDGKVKLYDGFTPFEVYAIHMCKKSFAIQCELKINYRGKISQWADNIQQTIKELTNAN
jgi:phosphate starvation-inducible protein PhoH